MRVVYVTLLSILLSSWIGQSRNGDSELDKVIEELSSRIANSQIGHKDSNIFVKKQFGLYPCDIRINFCCSSEKTLLRDAFSVFDNNAFVTLWVTSILLETTRYKNTPLPSDEQLLNALTAVSDYRDKNRLDDDFLVFWPQTYNTTAGVWSCGPENLLKVEAPEEYILNFIHKLLDDLGLDKIWLEKFRHIQDLIDESKSSYHIPADFDDTFVNIGLGALLSNYAKSPNGSSAPFQRWSQYHENFTHATTALMKYAYRPHSGNLDNGMVDPRTFFYIREYLYQMEAGNRQGAFAVTWMLNLTEDRRTAETYAMPFNTNNIDLTVSSNFVYGLTAAILAGLGRPEEWFVDDLQMIYENTTDLLSWQIERNFSSRPDIALTYYPSVLNFYWFTARILNVIRTYQGSHGDELPFPVIGRVGNRLLDVVRNVISPTVVKMATHDEQNTTVYFDDFLGNNDKDLNGKAVNHAQDRVFSTAMAVNVLLYSWLKGDLLETETPAEVKEIVEKASQWLIQNTLSGKYKLWNAVFSGSVKTVDDLPFWYPHNVYQFLNGTGIPANYTHADYTWVVGVNGTIPNAVYAKLLKEKYINQSTPLDFHGYNREGAWWPFWSSEPWTYATSMLALTQYRYLKDSGQLDY